MTAADQWQTPGAAVARQYCPSSESYPGCGDRLFRNPDRLDRQVVHAAERDLQCGPATARNHEYISGAKAVSK